MYVFVSDSLSVHIDLCESICEQPLTCTYLSQSDRDRAAREAFSFRAKVVNKVDPGAVMGLDNLDRVV